MAIEKKRGGIMINLGMFFIIFGFFLLVLGIREQFYQCLKYKDVEKRDLTLESSTGMTLYHRDGTPIVGNKITYLKLKE